jgi:hypothetical protein
MSLLMLRLLPVLAQSTSSGTSDFFGAIMPLLITTFMVGVIWVGLMYLIAMRANERRRRKDLGLSPLPFVGKQVLEWIQQQRGQPVPIPAEPAPVIYAPAPSIPLPDLSALTEDLPLPDMEALLHDPAPPEAPSVLITPPPAGAVPSEANAAPTITLAATQSLPKTNVSLPLQAIPDDAVEIMRVLRDVDSGRLLVDMRGQIFGHLEGLDPKLRQRYENVIVELYQLAGEATFQARFGTAQAAKPAISPKTAKPSASSPLLNPDAEGTPPGIAGPIEDFLQHRLAVHPEWRGRNLHIHTTPEGGVRIEVDGEFYEAVSDVEDPDIRAFLQQTVADWSNAHI